jgi:hypothetical protein
MGKIKAILRTFEQSPDADILLASSIALGYSETNEYIQRDLEKYGEINEKAIRKVVKDPCSYFGSKYALREFRRNRDKSA